MKIFFFNNQEDNFRKFSFIFIDSSNKGNLGHSQSWKYKKQKKYEYYG